MRALSIRQPYVEQILRGCKCIEYRSRPTQIRERVLLYASMTAGPPKEFKKMGKHPGDLPTSAILGSVEIVGCVAGRAGYEWKLNRPKRLRKPLVPKNHPQPAWFFPF